MKDQESPRVVIGMDPHKRSVTIEVMTADEQIVGGGRFTTDARGYRAMRDYITAWPERTGAIEGCNGIRRHIAHRLIAMASRSSTSQRSYPRGHASSPPGRAARPTPGDAHSVALVGTRMTGLRPVVADEQLEILRTLVDRRRWEPKPGHAGRGPTRGEKTSPQGSQLARTCGTTH